MKPQLLELLYRSFDTELTAEQKKQLNSALAESEQLRDEKERLIELRASLASNPGEFEPFFETRLLERIRREKPQLALSRMVDSLAVMFRRVAIAGAFGALVLAAVNLTESDEITVGALFAMQDDATETIFQTPYEQVME